MTCYIKYHRHRIIMYIIVTRTLGATSQLCDMKLSGYVPVQLLYVVCAYMEGGSTGWHGLR